MQKSIMRISDGKIINRIEINEGSKWTPPDGHILLDDGKIGQTWDGEKFIDPEPIPEPEPEDPIIKLNRLEQELASLRDKLETESLEKEIRD